MAPTITLIEAGEVFTPDPAGVQSVLTTGQVICKIGQVDAKRLAAMDLPALTINAAGCYVTPGLIDPHANVIGAGGEQGPSSRMPELRFEEVVSSGISTIVGILGADAVTRTLEGVLGKVREFTAHGITGLMYTGAMQTPPPTLSGCIIDDLVLIPEVVGLGEVAIADMRSTEPTLAELARWVSQSFLGGNTGGKAGITRFHVGEGRDRLALLNRLLDEYDIPPRCIHPTHVTRTPELIPQAAALARRGCYVDSDTVDEGTAGLFVQYLEQGGPARQFTFSSDAQTPGGTCDKFYRELVSCVFDHRMPLERALPNFSTNAADALRLQNKGRLRPGADADILIIEKQTMRLRHVLARGRLLLRDGEICAPQGART